MAVEKKPVKIMETVLRDAHQSLIATRMTTEQMLPIIDKMDKVGYHAVECWGGATFDASLRFLHEDPWERLRKLRDGFKNTKLQMLFRGQNIWSFVFLKPSLNFLRRSHGSSFKNLRQASNVAPPQHSTALYPTLSILSTIGSICSVVILVAISD